MVDRLLSHVPESPMKSMEYWGSLNTEEVVRNCEFADKRGGECERERTRGDGAERGDSSVGRGGSEKIRGREVEGTSEAMLAGIGELYLPLSELLAGLYLVNLRNCSSRAAIASLNFALSSRKSWISCRNSSTIFSKFAC